MDMDSTSAVYTKERESALSNIKQLYSKEQIEKRIAEMAEQISRDYSEKDRPVVIGVMKGAIFFMADLVRNLRFVASRVRTLIQLWKCNRKLGCGANAVSGIAEHLSPAHSGC
jgi:hypothetical protein